MKRLFLGLGIAALAVVTAACSGVNADQTSGPAASAIPADAVVVVAKDIKFQTPTVDVAAGKPTTIVFDNQDGAPHNIDIKDASGAQVFKGDIVSGAKVTYSVPALAPGTYTFVCDVHPDMTGTITAK